MRKVALWAGVVFTATIVGAVVWLTATPALLGAG